jgi:hypothetical protein
MLELTKRPALLRERLLATSPEELRSPVKGSSRVDPSDFRSLRAFIEDNHPRHAILVCNERAPRVVEGIEILPWREFLARLWGGRILS